jgi:uncharacterized protein
MTALAAQLRAVALGPDRSSLAAALRRCLASDRAAMARAVQAALYGPAPTAGAAEPVLATPFQPVRAILVKPVGDQCDLRCTYCYEGQGADRLRSGRMKPAMLATVIDTTCQQAQGGIDFLWHGGEPTLAGRDFLAQAMALQAPWKERGLRIGNVLQSHGARMDDDWAAFLAEHGFSVGVSIDGPSWLHDRHRIDHQGRGSYDRVAAGVAALRRHGVAVAAITVISEAMLGHEAEILGQYRALGLRGADFHPRVGNLAAADAHPLDPVDYAAFMCRLWDAWRGGDDDFTVATFDDGIRFYLGVERRICYFSGRCGDIAAIDPDGAVTSCTRPFPRDRYEFGTLAKAPLSAISADDRFSRFRSEDLVGQQRTTHCRWHGLCGNGCPQHRLDGDGPAVDGANLYCACVSGRGGGYGALWAHIESSLLDMAAQQSPVDQPRAPSTSRTTSPNRPG